LALSPDGTKAAVAQMSQLTAETDLWLVDLTRNSRTRFTSDGNSSEPIWSPDSSRIIFTSIASTSGGWFDLYLKPVSGVANQMAVLKSTQFKFPTSWSRDGRSVLYTASYQKSRDDLWVLPMQEDRKPVLLAGTEANEGWGYFSPDGHWIAYTADESGRNEVYLRPFPNAGDKIQVSRGGGIAPRWRGDGKELFYIAPDGRLMGLELNTSPVLRAGEPKMLFTPPRSSGVWDVSKDGRFLIAVPVEASAQEPLTVVLNWSSGLPK
jgi:Tol biopolymer transport system component